MPLWFETAVALVSRKALPETPAALAVRRGVRKWLGDLPIRPSGVVVALSGGADSLALTAAAVAEIGEVEAVVVDHQLQSGSGEVAARAVDQALELGCVAARVVPVDVGRVGGVEAAARQARYAALEQVRDGRPVLLGHTLDDQAETVLLGLARGAGGRSLQGMAAWNAPWGRPLLEVRRADTVGLCADLGITPWDDPHNVDPRYTRVRLRTEVLPLLEDVLGGGVAQALARTADHLRADGQVIDGLAAELSSVAHSDPAGLSCEILATAPVAVRRRAIRDWLAQHGVNRTLNAQLQAIDALVSEWRGQGAVAVGGGDPARRLVVAREHGTLTVRTQPRTEQ
ncbi:tRNA lysidine(34) synthetase TilS [Nocardia camponoti]|uniref:tRNA(Ile)-lysidine synthase n=1 Tax=Nocardia camponoti TaxID=1616106 RepID=A0A917VB67_9NOCA|nr:tRNA lysidine(34) synthetase TilS [Nocardia camponoti]GGK60453.1 tRNA(Ile)-lysidine synthase [Nocardia camponoti]